MFSASFDEPNFPFRGELLTQLVPLKILYVNQTFVKKCLKLSGARSAAHGNFGADAVLEFRVTLKSV